MHSSLAGALLTALVLLLQACSGSGLHVKELPESGYAKTINYQFQAAVHFDSLGTCRQMSVRVKPISKGYAYDKPPDRLQLFDDDCTRPVKFDRVQYLSNRTGELVRLSGIDLEVFWDEFARLQFELMDWLFQEGAI